MVLRNTVPEGQKIAAPVAFYNERVDLFIDGELHERPGATFRRSGPGDRG